MQRFMDADNYINNVNVYGRPGPNMGMPPQMMQGNPMMQGQPMPMMPPQGMMTPQGPMMTPQGQMMPYPQHMMQGHPMMGQHPMMNFQGYPPMVAAQPAPKPKPVWPIMCTNKDEQWIRLPLPPADCKPKDEIKMLDWVRGRGWDDKIHVGQVAHIDKERQCALVKMNSKHHTLVAGCYFNRTSAPSKRVQRLVAQNNMRDLILCLTLQLKKVSLQNVELKEENAKLKEQLEASTGDSKKEE